MKLEEIFRLEPHGLDVVVGAGPKYPWGGLYGGQIVAQGLLAAAQTVDEELAVHSLRAYFIRRGDQDEPVRYEVDRIRNGRSFATRRVVARQAVGAILNLEASFQRPEESVDRQTIQTGGNAYRISNLTVDQWSPTFERAFLPPSELEGTTRTGAGRAAAWLRTTEPVLGGPVVQAAALAYMSDDLPTDAAVRAHPVGAEPEEVRYQVLFTASLDHTIWFHQAVQADQWLLHDFTCHRFVGGRGLTLGHVFDQAGTHVATVAQEVLLRDSRHRNGETP